MGEKYIDIFQEFNNMQTRIGSLFQDILNERNQYKLQTEDLGKNLAKLCSEIRDTKTQNVTLKEIIAELKNIVSQCFQLFRNINCLNLDRNTRNVIEVLKTSFFELDKKVESSILSKDVKLDSKEYELQYESQKKRIKLDEEQIKKEIDSVRKLNFSSQFFFEEDNNENEEKNITKNQLEFKSTSEEVLQKVFEKANRNYFEVARGNEESLVQETETLNSDIATHSLITDVRQKESNILDQKIVNRTLDKSSVIKSPVFKDFSNRNQESTPLKECDKSITKSSPLKLVNEKFLMKNASLNVSPLKIPPSQNEREVSTPKRSNGRHKLESPKRSPGLQLKNSNLKEAEITVSGVRKLTQTLLNIDCFRKNSPQKKKDSYGVENENWNFQKAEIEPKALIDIEDDDVIMESPKKSEEIFVDDFGKSKKKNENTFNEVQYLTPPTNLGAADLDETFVSSSVVRKSKFSGKKILERIVEDETPQRRSTREKSPEYDSVPFVYKREAVRKKAERMKLPGHTCLECDKYYKDVFGSSVNSNKIKEVLNKCSRHRDKFSPTSDETPAGYWKPYLTATNVVSPNKNDTPMR